MTNKDAAGMFKGKSPNRTVAASLLVIFLAGALFAWGMVARAVREKREDLLQQTQLVTREVEVGEIQALTGTAADLNSAVYLRLKEYFVSFRSANPHCRFVYLAGRRPDGTVFIFIDSESPGSKDYFPPGQVYSDDPGDFRRVFDSQVSAVVGPGIDRGGTRVSGLVPIINPHTRKVIAVLGMDIDARAWDWDVVLAGFPPFLFTLVLMGIAIVSVLARARLKLWRYAEVVITVLIGLTLTIAVAWLAHTGERQHHRDAFFQFAQPQVARILEVFHSLSRIELEAMGRFFEGKQNVSKKEFLEFVGFLSRNPVIQAWEWIPAVSEADRLHFEQEVRQEGLFEFGIWQKDKTGNRASATGRDVYFPVLYVAPITGNECALGYDLGSEPVRRAAIDEAKRTGFVSGTDAITLVQETGNQKGILVCRPIFKGDGSKLLRGFALAVLRFGSLLETAIAGNEGSSAVTMNLFLLHANKPSEKLASTRKTGESEMRTEPFSVAYPIFAFGKTFSLIASPNRAFEDLYPMHAGWTAALVGLVLTFSLAFWVGMTLRRREELERLVAERTNTLRENMEKQRLLIENSHDIIYTLTVEGIFNFVSHAWSTLLGHPVSEVVGRPFQKFVHPEDLGKCELFFRKMIENGLPHTSIDYRVQHADGAWRWHVSNVIPLRDKDGTILGIEGSAGDITDRKLAEEEIRRQAGLISSLLDSIPDIIFFKDVQGVYLGCNPSFAKLVGRAREEIIGKTDYDLFDKEAADLFRENDKKMIGLREPRHNEEWITYPGDRKILIDTLKTPYWGPDGSLIGILGISRDITERKRAEEALRESSDMVQLLMNSTAEAIYGLDKNGLCTFVNAACLKILGYEQPEQLLGRNMHDVIHSKRIDGDPYDVTGCPIFRAFKAGQEAHVDDEVLWRSDGTSFSAEYWSYPIRQDGKIIGAVVTFLDITERKEAENALIESNLFLQETQRIARLSGWKANPHTDYLEWTEEVFEIIEFPKGKQPGLEEGLKFYLPEYIPALKEKIIRCLDAGERFAMECRGVTGKGRTIWTEVRGLVTISEEGRSYVMGTLQDITERKRAEGVLRQVSDRLSLAARAGGVGIWDYDVVKNRLVWDDQMYHLYGISQDQFSGAYESWQAGLHPEDRQRGDEEIQRALRGEKEFDTEFRVLWPDGIARNIRALAIVQRDTSGKPVHMIGTNWDITAQKKTEAALRESEGNFRTFFESMTDMFMVGTPDGRILFTNAAVIRTLGYSVEELAGMRLIDLHPAGKRQEAEDIFAAMFLGEMESCPLPLERKDGSLVPVETRVWFGRWNGEECIFGISKNLTTQQEEQQRFERLFHNNPALMALSALPERRFADVNDAFLKALGYSRKEVLGKTAEDILLFISPEQEVALVNKLQAERRIIGFEMQIRRKDGTILDGLFSGEVLSSQGQQYLLTVMIDITERKKAERALKESDEKLRIIFENAAVAIMFANEKEQIVLWNPFTETLLQMNPADLHQRLLSSLYPDEEWARIRLMGIRDKGVIQHLETCMIRKDGGRLDVDISISVLKDPEGRITGSIGIVRDITERRRMAEALGKAYEGLEDTVQARTRELRDAQEKMLRSEKLVAIGQLASSVAHELRNPLGVMKNVVYYLRMLEPVTTRPEIMENLDTISEEIESSNKIISDLLEFSRIKKPTVNPVNINTIVKETISRLVPAPRVEILTEFDETLDEIGADALQIQQIFINLASNALQAMEQGGKLMIRTKKAGDFIEVSFEDTGSGISEANMARIFEPLFSTKINGTGLGLSICYSLVEGHGGKIDVLSEVGRGSVFTVRLPVRAG